jgi:hypothetical protein
MALVIGVDLGDVVDIGEGWVCVAAIQNKETVVIVASDGARLLISPHCELEVFPKVWIQLAENGTRKPMRFVIEAPKAIPITRRPEPPGTTATRTPGLDEARIMEAIIREHDEREAASRSAPKKGRKK